MSVLIKISIFPIIFFITFSGCSDDETNLISYEPEIQQIFDNFEYSGNISDVNSDVACIYAGQTFTLFIEISGSRHCKHFGQSGLEEIDCSSASATSIYWPLSGELQIGETEIILLSGSVSRRIDEGQFSADIELDDDSGPFGEAFFEGFNQNKASHLEELYWNRFHDENGWEKCLLTFENQVTNP
ncbi:MAG: hypothetical protein JXX14_12340 [Deltaproteobacteria bacterium]|nr:hypothetical protein [Deltaproteobacteria bacterium]